MESINRWVLTCQNHTVITGTGMFESLGLDTSSGPQQPNSLNTLTVCDMGDGNLVFMIPGNLNAPDIYPTATDSVVTDYQVVTNEAGWMSKVTEAAKFQAIPTGDGYFVLWSQTFRQYLKVNAGDNTVLQVLGQLGQAARFTATGLDHDAIIDLVRVGKSAEGMVFPQISLDSVNLSGSNLSRCDFRNVTSFNNCLMNGATLQQANFAGRSLSGLQLAGADCTGADFTGCGWYFYPGPQPPVLAQANLTQAEMAIPLSGLTSVKMPGAVLAEVNLTDVDLSGVATDLTGANLSGQGTSYFAYVPAPQAQIPTTGLSVVAYDFTGSGHLDHLVYYDPGSGSITILNADSSQPGGGQTVYINSGIGGFTLADPADRIIAYDYESTGHLNYLVCYRPGRGAISIIKKVSDSGDPDAMFAPVYHQDDPGGTGQGSGIGGFTLTDPRDRVIAYDYNGTGHLDHLLCYRPGTGMIVILKKTSDTDSPDAFTAVYDLGDPGGTGQGRGIGGFTLADPEDRIIAYDYESTGHLDHLVCYRPASGQLWILKKVDDTNSYGAFSPVYTQDPSWSGGDDGFTLADPAAQVIAYDYEGTGLLDDLICYRPGNIAGRVWIQRRISGKDGPATFDVAYRGGGIGSLQPRCDLTGSADRVLAYDSEGSGKLDSLVCYRPASGSIWAFQRKAAGPATLTRCKLGEANLSGANLAGTDLSGLRLSGVKLLGADLSGSKVIGTDLTGVDLTGARFSSPLIRSADPKEQTVLAGCTLPYAAIKLDWSNLILTGATIIELPTNSAGKVDLTGLNAVSLQWPQADFTEYILDGANFSGAVLEQAKFIHASLGQGPQKPASFYHATMPGAKFIRAVLDQADLSSVTLGGVVNIEAADFTNAFINNCDFSQANLFGVIFSGVTMTGRNKLVGAANLQEASFFGAYMPNVDFTGAHLEGAKFDHAFMVECILTRATLTAGEQGSIPASLSSAFLQAARLDGAKLAGTNLADAVITKDHGTIGYQYRDESGALTPLNTITYPARALPAPASFSSDTTCPNEMTYGTNQASGLPFEQMMARPGGLPAQWAPPPQEDLSDHQGSS